MAIRRALVSVYDKSGIVEFCRGLSALGVEIISTGGTATQLRKAKIKVKEVSSITGFPEMLQGRVKTLHPKIHGGILYKRGEKAHEKDVKKHSIAPIDVVVANLYPFEKTSAQTSDMEKIIEDIDIGGPAMVRAAAKNFRHVVVVVDPGDYAGVLWELQRKGDVSEKTRYSLMLKAFERTGAYDWAISSYFSSRTGAGDENEFPAKFEMKFEEAYPLRYGENPHQKAVAYRRIGKVSLFDAKVHSGKQMSYNNFLDADSALGLILEFKEDEPTTVIIKHNNPCGGATASTLAKSYELAHASDPESAFGSIMAFNRRLDVQTANAIGSKFVEVVLAPGFEPAALEILKQKPSRRILDVTQLFAQANKRKVNYRNITGGMLYQQSDDIVYDIAEAKVATKKKPAATVQADLHFAMKFAKHTKSNAIVLAKNLQVIGVGAGQMSRIDACNIAIEKAKRSKFEIRGSACASDAFLPFRDTLDRLAQEGIEALTQPGGSVRDSEVINAADGHGIAMVFTGVRHFKH
ncbi:bifunctional phosphoribosylaminoimidazolecarboxamide formyltransferase/IMP cyclohydrolase [Candidatus Micrarchaeota archaeon]|nr:bifunctional phosphoribosylaminoimidazolecarboxamide formyltransferase/IMP cyclohydrolase [Candidatus Micrarchaeota archaeon]